MVSGSTNRHSGRKDVIMQNDASPRLYVHVPFCRSRCTYCDFHVAALRPGVVSEYVAALVAEIRKYADSGFRPRTIFVGGGTPSALPIDEWKLLLSTLSDSFSGDLVEWTIEANPESICKDKIQIALGLGVDRFSTGAQTFSEKGLSLMGRRHDAERVSTVHQWFSECGVPRTSLDLIVGWPGQDLESIEVDLESVRSIDPDHISLYHLSYEAGTWLHAMRERGGLKPLLDESCIEYSNTFLNGLADQGYQRYEVSNLAKRGGASLHNLNYWLRGEYLGVGSGAASFLKGKRWKNKPDVSAYISKAGKPDQVDVEFPDSQRTMTELIMLQLRLAVGLDTRLFSELTSIDFLDVCGGSLRIFAEQGLLVQEADRIFATDSGFDLLDSIILQFVEDVEKSWNAGT